MPRPRGNPYFGMYCHLGRYFEVLPGQLAVLLLCEWDASSSGVCLCERRFKESPNIYRVRSTTYFYSEPVGGLFSDCISQLCFVACSLLHCNALMLRAQIAEFPMPSRVWLLCNSANGASGMVFVRLAGLPPAAAPSTAPRRKQADLAKVFWDEGAAASAHGILCLA
jgi:hypothetical protein